jgi:hypothetical protein
MELNNSSKPDTTQMKMDAKKKLLYPAVALDVLAIAYFLVISYAENQEGPTKVHFLFAAVYNAMGKIGGTALFFGLGMLMVILFAVKMMKIKKME